ncbi:MAG TPA: amidophosphoribosyltransferase [Bryobacteraceae bacterium]|nr:amidophosphoribosyltransferase [Bryobacteraceae bacterium]
MAGLHEKCGVFGIYARGLEAARLAHTGLWTLQHRGQESSGISAADGDTIRTHKGPGLVAHVYDERSLSSLTGHIAIGHNRYSTSGGAASRHSQPVISGRNQFALAHNGNLPSVSALSGFAAQHGIDATGANDSELMHAAIEHVLAQGATPEDAVRSCFDLFTGVFSVVVMTRNRLAAFRDTHGVRPLSIGRLRDGLVVSSETCAIDAVGGTFLRDVRPGELIIVDDAGLHSIRIAEGEEKLDIFEFVYFARPDSVLLGRRVNEVRRNLGIHLAREHRVDADVIIPVPDSAVPAAIGYASESRIPLDFGLVKNRYIHRTFIRPAQNLRESGVRMKLNPISEVLRSKSVGVVDDSIVRGTTARHIVEMLRRSGARQVHFLVSSPPVRFPDFYGIDTPKPDDLVAARMSVEDTRQLIGADSLCYLSYEGMIEATGLPENIFSASCFNGIYPVEIGVPEL